MSVLIMREQKRAAPVEAVGVHGELLEEISIAARGLIELVELERLGIYDGFGAGFWINSDSVLVAAQRLVKLAERRAAELKDVGIETISRVGAS